jgi:hypothetical protein
VNTADRYRDSIIPAAHEAYGYLSNFNMAAPYPRVLLAAQSLPTSGRVCNGVDDCLAHDRMKRLLME